MQNNNQNFLEELKEYFRTTSKEKILEDWNKSQEYDKIGPTVDEYIQACNVIQNYRKQLITQMDNIPKIISPDTKIIDCFHETRELNILKRVFYSKYEDESLSFFLEDGITLTRLKKTRGIWKSSINLIVETLALAGIVLQP